MIMKFSHIVLGLIAVVVLSQNMFAERNELVHFPDPRHTEHNMSVLIRSLGGIDISPGSELGCVTTAGYVAGAINLDDDQNGQWGMAVWGDDLATENVDGFEVDEDLRFIYWDAEHDWELDLDITIAQGNDFYQINGFLVIDAIVSAPEIEPVTPISFGITELFPNPFNNTLKIKFSLLTAGHTEIDIQDILGKNILSVFSGSTSRGVYQLNFRNQILPSGSYFVALKQNDLISKQKVVLLK